ncbi:hypothetical protein GQ457_02G014600 [Hibiscus cannabinus]
MCKLPRFQNLDLSNNPLLGSLPENLNNCKQLYRKNDLKFKDNEKGERLDKQGKLVAIDKGSSFELDELLRVSAYVMGKSRLEIVYKVVLGNGISVAVRRLGDEAREHSRGRRWGKKISLKNKTKGADDCPVFFLENPKMIKLHFSITVTVFLLISHVNSVKSGNNKCQGSCVTGNSTRFLPFPFGFSSACPIQLNCSSTTGVAIGDFHVLNVTSTDIIVDLPDKCDRQLASLAVLFGANYALSAANYLLLGNCSKALQSPCEISTTFLERSFKVKPCVAQSDNMSCLTRRHGRRLLSFDEVNNTQCRFVFSSTTILADPASESAFSLEMGRVNLEWWVKGECNCDTNAGCKKVKNGNKTVGFRCLCNEGFEGDGFKEGGGCRRVSECNASKFMSGQCGGTRVGVLIGGLVVAGALLMGGVVLLGYYVRRCCNSSNKQMNAKRRLCEATGNMSVPFYAYREIERATDGFSDKQRLGTGAYALKVVDFSRPHCEVNLAALAIDRIGRGCVDEIIDPYLDLHGDAWTLSSIHNAAELAFRCLSFHPDMRPTMLEVAEELERIRLSAWVPYMCVESPSASSCPSSDEESETSSSAETTIEKSVIVESRRLMVKQMEGNCLTWLDDVKTSSPVSVQNHWLSERSSSSTNSLFGNESQRE